jgi:hypothetical protein
MAPPRARRRGRRPGPVTLGCLQAVMHGVLLWQPHRPAASAFRPSSGARLDRAAVRCRIGPRARPLSPPLRGHRVLAAGSLEAAQAPAGPAPRGRGAASCTVQIAEVSASNLCRTRRSAAESPSRAAAIASSAAAREPVQPGLEERADTRVAAPVSGGGKCGAAGRAHLGDDRAGRPADLGRGRRQFRLDAAEHVQLEQVRPASHLVLVYLVAGSDGNSAPFMSRDIYSMVLGTRVPGTMVLFS